MSFGEIGRMAKLGHEGQPILDGCRTGNHPWHPICKAFLNGRPWCYTGRLAMVLEAPCIPEAPGDAT